jgi:(4S)-4-hydroxy-5-phosphonooxypentane-2,3-dione isomerase
LYAIFVSIRVKPEHREQFLAAIEDDAICSERDEPGCLRFNVLQDQQDENRYFFYEVYADEAAFKAHQTYPHYDRWRAAAAEFLDGPTERMILRPVIPREQSYWRK